MKVTPFYKDQRYTFEVKENEPLPRGRWQRTFTIAKGELKDHKLVLKGASCGLPNCMCDAKIVAIQ